MSNKQIVDQIKEYEEKLASLRSQLDEAEKPWEGPTGDWVIGGTGEIYQNTIKELSGNYHATGHCAETKEHVVAIRNELFNLAWLIHARDIVRDGWKPDWENEVQGKWGVYYNHAEQCVVYFLYFRVSAVFDCTFQTKAHAEHFVEMVGVERIRRNEMTTELERIVMRDELLLAALLLNRLEPMAPHHVSAVRERLGYPTDDELRERLRTGKLA